MYNPYILSYSADLGSFQIQLQAACEHYGKFPSEFNRISVKASTDKERKNRKALNVELGVAITEQLNNPASELKNLKGFVYEFFQRWHRKWDSEFGINIKPFLNMNTPCTVYDVVSQNRDSLIAVWNTDFRSLLVERNIFRQDTMNSISGDNALLQKALEKIRKIRHSRKDLDILDVTKSHVECRLIEPLLKNRIGISFEELSELALNTYADEVASFLGKVNAFFPIQSIDKLRYVRNLDVEFEYASRDVDYLNLGRKIGDCTADKSNLQTDQDVENIFWTVFAWLLDRNYQILKVYYAGELVMKWHLLPLFYKYDSKEHMYLSIDAIETTPRFRDDIAAQNMEKHLENSGNSSKNQTQESIIAHRDKIFDTTMQFVTQLAFQMGIKYVYAEKFSNTRWVREKLTNYSDIYLDVTQIVKVDELEDIYEAAAELCSNFGKPNPSSVFMEVQAKNTYLIPELVSNRYKSFSMIVGEEHLGIPLTKVIKV